MCKLSKYIKISVATLFFILFSTKNVIGQEKLDTSEFIIEHLGIESLDLNSVDAKKVINSSVKFKDNPKLVIATIYRLYGSVYNKIEHKINPSLIKYNVQQLDKDTINSSKKYVMNIVSENVFEKNQEETLIPMCYLILGFNFIEDEEVVLWLFKEFKDADNSVANRAAALDALIEASGEKYKYYVSMAFDLWFRSPVAKEGEMAFKVIAANKARKRDNHYLLSHLICCWFTSHSSSRYYNSLERTLKYCYTSEQLIKFSDILAVASAENANNTNLKRFTAWVNSQKK
jgi:hypothetical protein